MSIGFVYLINRVFSHLDAEHEGPDHEGPADDSKTGDETVESLKLVEVVDDLKLEIEEQKESEEAKTSGDKDDEHVEEGDVKKEDGELSVDVHRESKLRCLLT